MRLIDADALIEKYTVVIRKAADEKLKTEIAVLLKDIEAQPTIKAVPVKRAKWIEKSTGGEHFHCCSKCGYVEWDTPSNYCSRCGARMGEDERD